jgi:hypothetical protein
MLDRGRGQDARAPGGVIGIERTGEMDAALGGGTFASNDTIADDGQSVSCGIAAGRLRHAIPGGLGTRGRHSMTSQFLLFFVSFSTPDVNG